ncbi:MAG: dialkylresorcinol condensing enzyme DarA [Flavobacteriaceae bacterium]|nr:dialkylresorcinol condensing enzyme DarA [Flavobacteriaceae bacterium]
MKKILVLYYSQSGQLEEILKQVCSSIDTMQVQIDYQPIASKRKFKFPWKKPDFFDAFPESFLEKAEPIEAIPEAVLNTNYDLIVLGYTVWYLSPSIPTASFLQSEAAKKLLSNKAVITLNASRNMWIMAQEKVKKYLQGLDVKLVGNIALVDRHINHISVITIVQWMFSGKKEKYLGIFPKPGVSDKDIAEAKKFGKPIEKALLQESYDSLQAKLLKLGGVKVKPFLVLADQRANILFGKWAKFITSNTNKDVAKRKRLLKLFNYYLLFAIWVIAPIVFIVFLITYVFRIKHIERQKAYYSSVEYKQD